MRSFQAVRVCPACGSQKISVVRGSNYRCEECSRCWSYTVRGPSRVDPVTCPGCTQRDACFELLRSDFPSWEPPDLS